MSKDNKDMHQTDFMVPPTAPFSGSKLDHKIKEAEELAERIDAWAKGAPILCLVCKIWRYPGGKYTA